LSVNAVSEGPTAHRLTFVYDGDRVQLTSNQTVSVKTPAPQQLNTPVHKDAFAATVRDTSGNVVYRRVEPNPMREDKEVFGPESLHRIPIDRSSGTFVVFVPHLTDDDVIELVRPARAEETAGAGSRVIGRFKLHGHEGHGGNG
jgi:hypothetical protein